MTTTTVQRVFKALGTVNSIYIADCPDKGAVDAAVTRVMEIDDKMSVFKPTSEISRINEYAGLEAVSVSEDTMHLLKRSLHFSEITGGAFDITAAPLVELWGIGHKNDFIPDKEVISEVRSLVDYHGLVLDEKNGEAMLAGRGQSITLGGIAKGYAADEVKRILNEYGIENAMINLGGNIWALGSKMRSQRWMIGVQNPFSPFREAIGELFAKDQTVVTSGSYEKYFIKNDVLYHHILHPQTGLPSDSGLVSVTLIGRCSMDMDALATSVFILGQKKGARLVKRLGAEAIFIDSNLNVMTTDGISSSFNLFSNGTKSMKHRGVI